MKRFALTALALAIATPAWAQQSHAGHNPAPAAGSAMPMLMPDTVADQGIAADPDQGQTMPDQMVPDQATAEDPHAGHNPDAMTAESGDEVGSTPAPAPPEDHAADAIYDPAEMAGSRDTLRAENGGSGGSMVLFDLAELQVRQGREGFRWEGEAWFGGDIDRLQIKIEGEATFGGPLEELETQVLFSHAVAPYWNLNLGLRYDLRPDPSRSYAVIGIEGIAPYWFHTSGQLFISDKGDFRFRAEGSYDQNITQRLVLSPRAELNVSAQDMLQIGVGSGFTDVELGLRLRYEVEREFAPYVGVEWSSKLGSTSRYARLRGEEPAATNFVVGIRFWF